MVIIETRARVCVCGGGGGGKVSLSTSEAAPHSSLQTQCRPVLALQKMCASGKQLVP